MSLVVTSLLLSLQLLGMALSWETSITESCTTRLRSKPAMTTTITTTRYSEYISTSTYTPRLIITNYNDTVTYPFTETSFVYECAENTTRTFTETTYSYVYVNTESTYIYSNSLTLTSGKKTSTVPPPPGFTPVASQYANNTSLHPAAVAAAVTGTNTRIVCHEKFILETTLPSYIRYSSTITATENDTAVTWEYNTITSTSSIPCTDYDYSFTSETVTDTFVDVTYTTTTVTQTTTVPILTTYPACATNNVVSRLGSGEYQYIENAFSNVYPFISDTYDPYTCCEQCFQFFNCTGMSWISGRCYLYVVTPGSICNGSAPGAWGYDLGEGYGETPLFVANGPCGQGQLLVP